MQTGSSAQHLRHLRHLRPQVFISRMAALGRLRVSSDYSWVNLDLAQLSASQRSWGHLAQNTAQISRNALASGFYGNGSNRGLAPSG